MLHQNLLGCFILSMVLLLSNVKGQVNDDVMNNALLVGQKAQLTIQEVIEQKLPAAVRTEGEQILNTFNLGLTHCNVNLRSNNDIDLYKTCVEGLQSMAMSSLGEVLGQYWATSSSGAGRLTLFW